MIRPEPPHLVLAGGGHTHVAVLKDFCRHPPSGARVTLVSPNALTPYTGVLPGHIAGHYTFDQMHIDLRPLCRGGGLEFIEGKIIGLDLARHQAILDTGGRLGFDLLSLDIGATPPMDTPGAAQFALAIKPVDRFLAALERLQQQILQSAKPSFRIVVAGGGAGGVEVLLAVQHHFRTLAAAAAKPEFHLVADSPTILPTHNPGVQRIFTRILAERGVIVHLNHRVAEVTPTEVICTPGSPVACDAVIWVTGAAAPAWLAQSGLHTDPNGFVAVNDTLQSTSHPHIFAAGDIAAVIPHPRPKSGVFAVRQGPPLTRNLRLALAGRPLAPFVPQKEFLSLISTGDRYAVGSRGKWAFEGKWVWRFKHWIDMKWLRRYQL
jgi:selenide,water dikinase